MKYIVELKYTNPGHEHVSLRRRVDTVTRLVEASSEEEALNRAANQQRALGFKIQEAKVVQPEVKSIPEVLKEEVEQIDELKKSTLGSYVNKAAHQVRAKSGIAASFETQGERKRDPERKASYMDLAKDYRKGAKKRLAGIEKATAKLAKEEVDQVEEGFDPDPKDIAAYLVNRHGKGKVTQDHVDAYERRRDSHRGIDKEEVMKHVKKMSEEVEQIEERNKQNALARKTLDALRGARFKAQGNYVPDPEPEHKTDLAHNKAVGRALRQMSSEEVGADKRDAGYKMSPAVAAAQKKSDELSKVVKRPQAGTLAAVHKSMERTMERNMKKEAADPGAMKVVNKKVKAADKMIGAAKKAAVVNFEPELKITRPMI